MGINESLIGEFQQELKSTRKILERVPCDKADWKPHEKSMTLGRLASHVAENPFLIIATLSADELDLAKTPYVPFEAKNNDELLKKLDDSSAEAIELLKKASDEDLMRNWSMRDGEKIFMTMPKIASIRMLGLNHWYHHRGQLGVYLRLQNVPLPSIYGPTADEGM